MHGTKSAVLGLVIAAFAPLRMRMGLLAAADVNGPEKEERGKRGAPDKEGP